MRQIVLLVMVPSMAAKDISHCLNQAIQHRAPFKPSTIYTDTCPNNDRFWKGHFGEDTATKLGLFHLIQRVVDTMNKQSQMYWQAMVQLKNCFYTYDQLDEANVIQALKNGHFTGNCYTTQQICDLRHSKRWNQRYAAYIKKHLLHGEVIVQRLQTWVRTFEDKQDIVGRTAFTTRTIHVVEEQVKRLENKSDLISDPPGASMYRIIPPGPRSKHNLPKYVCERPESPLEHFHEELAHFANRGMAQDLAYALTMGGTSEVNIIKEWHKLEINDLKLQGKDTGIIGHFEDSPYFYDHSYLEYLNTRLIGNGLPPVFHQVKHTRKNNPERFLNYYLCEQVIHNKQAKILGVTGSSSCECAKCPVLNIRTKTTATILLQPPLPGTRQQAPPTMTQQRPQPPTLRTQQPPAQLGTLTQQRPKPPTLPAHAPPALRTQQKAPPALRTQWPLPPPHHQLPPISIVFIACFSSGVNVCCTKGLAWDDCGVSWSSS
jgi:hypothetical protein